MECSLPRSSVHGILQARILEWVAIPLSRDRAWVSSVAGGFFTVGATSLTSDMVASILQISLLPALLLFPS